MVSSVNPPPSPGVLFRRTVKYVHYISQAFSSLDRLLELQARTPATKNVPTLGETAAKRSISNKRKHTSPCYLRRAEKRRTDVATAVRVDIKSVSDYGPSRSVVFQLGDDAASRPRSQKFSRDTVVRFLRAFDALPPRRKRKDGKDFKYLLRVLEAGGVKLDRHRQQPDIIYGSYSTYDDVPVAPAPPPDNRALTQARERVVAASIDRVTAVDTTESAPAQLVSGTVMPDWGDMFLSTLSSAIEDGDRQAAAEIVAGYNPDELAEILDVNFHVAFPRSNQPERELFDEMWRVREYIESYVERLIMQEEGDGDSD
jgi:hypothetical protein